LFADDVRAYPEAMNEVIRDIPLGRLGRLEEIAWTIASLAEEGGISRSVLAERFRYYLDQSPMAYLTSWRLQLGAQMLSSTNYSVAQIAAEVGYESEAAFNRAFKRAFELPPARFRNQSRVASGTTSPGNPH
jgi:AraC-like DNA-binding protein